MPVWTTHLQSRGVYILPQAEVWTRHHRGGEMPFTPGRQDAKVRIISVHVS